MQVNQPLFVRFLLPSQKSCLIILFTTLVPNLRVRKSEEAQSFVIQADIPGII